MNYKHFTKDDRNELSILLKKGYLQKEIAETLSKDPSSISREIRCNSTDGVYDPKKAHAKSRVKRSKSKYQCMKIVKYPELAEYIEINLRDNHWTPEEIAGRWNNNSYLDKNGGKVKISIPSIYKYLYSNRG